MNRDQDTVLENVKSVLQVEAFSIKACAERIDNSFAEAINLIMACKGKVVMTGLGKSGLVARKISATLSSLGTQSIFLHPAEALHGDIGMIDPTDIVFMLSNSGETGELILLLGYLNRYSIDSICLTGDTKSTLGSKCTAVLDGKVEEEACTHNLAPTSSTTLAMAIGDAIAVVISRLKKFKREDFARYHPGGSLGKRLLYTVGDKCSRDFIPFCEEDDQLIDVVKGITYGNIGTVFVVRDSKLVGIITDGDVRRALDKFSSLEIRAKDMMTKEPIKVQESYSIDQAYNIFKERSISCMPVTCEKNKVVGSLSLSDLD